MSPLINKGRLILSNLVFGLRSILWKKDESVVLCGSWFGTKFADNSRFLFQYLSKEKEKFGLSHVIWVTRNKEVRSQLSQMGYEVFMMDSKESIYWHKRAKYHIVCNKGCDGNGYKGDILGQYSFRAKRINLWHGVAGIKGVGFSSNEYKTVKQKKPRQYAIKEFLITYCKAYRLFAQDAGGWADCFYLTTTSADTDLIQQRNLLPRNLFIESGFPRNCPCPCVTDEEQKVLDLMKNHKVILYLPTFRSSAKSFSTADVAKCLEGTLKEKNILWIQKAHTADKDSDFEQGVNGNILTLFPEFDINVLLPVIDILVTDYSSVASDAMCHNKLVIYYVPDYEEYREGSRGFAINPDEIMCGPRAFSMEMLREAILDYIDDPDKGKTDKYTIVRSKYWNDVFDLGEIWRTIVSCTD